MKKLNWNQISELGLIERINKEILHPLGLAMYREVETGDSPGAYIADDGIFKYSTDFKLKNYIDEKVRQKLQEMLNADGVCQTLGPGCKGCPDCPGKSVCFVGLSGDGKENLAAVIAEASAKEVEKAADYMMDYLGIARDVTSVSKRALYEYAAKVRANGGAV